MALLTLTRGLPRKYLDADAGFDLPAQLRVFLNELEFDRLLYEQMSNRSLSDSEEYLTPLEPDLVGEFFVEDYMVRHARKRRRLVDLAWTLEPAGAAVFAGMVEADYGTSETDPLRYLPSTLLAKSEVARLAAKALAVITIFYETRLLWDKYRSTAPPWLDQISRPDKSSTVVKLTEEFRSIRDERRMTFVGGGLDAGI